MIPLEKSLRNKLEKTVKEAREVSEAAAKAALGQLGVGEAEPFKHLTESERDLRRQLRIHGRQLGDALNDGRVQTIDRLVEETAYEHWHRMLFARFLAENDLLMYPDPDAPIAVSLEECEDLAAEEGARNGWELAARFAARMLPQIFRPDSPVFQLLLPPEHEQRLEQLVAELPPEVFTASDSLGWVYQFWQAKKKDEVNASEVKIGARELPAVTQLFTEPYMVAFLLDNSLGAWWAGKRLTEADLRNAANEEELRQKAGLTGVPLTYLRFVKTDNGSWMPAAGVFPGWPDDLKEFKVLDPCCGSGHFLVAAFLMLVAMRMEMEKLSAQEVVDAVLRDNLHGLEIDQRCVELAVFALALSAWRYPEAGGYRSLPRLNVACSGLSVSIAKDEWKKLAANDHNMRIALDWMYEVFRDAPVLGSLINPARSDSAKLVKWEDFSQTLEKALAQEGSEEEHEAGVVAQGLARAAILLTWNYHWIVTNVPFLARNKQDDKLKEFCEKGYRTARKDLATVFLDRCLEFCCQGGTASIVLPQNWLFLTSYKNFREKLLTHNTFRFIARLGANGFQTPMWDFNIQLLVISQDGALAIEGKLSADSGNNSIRGVDVSELRAALQKAEGLLHCKIKELSQKEQMKNPDARILMEETRGELLAEFGNSSVGIQTGDYPRFVCNFWEPVKTDDWEGFQTTVTNTDFFGGVSQYIFYEKGKGALRALAASEARDRRRDKQGQTVWGKPGIAVSCMGRMPVALYLGTKFDNNVAIVSPDDAGNLPAIWNFCTSSEYAATLRQIDQKLNVTNATLVKVPFDVAIWQQFADKLYPNGLPKPFSDDPTQWIFHGHPCGSVVWDEEKKWTVHGPLRCNDTVVQVAIARLLGYRWPAELDTSMELADEARELAEKSELLLPFAGDDGIVCIPPVRGEAPAADRLLNLLAAAYNDNWTSNTLSELLAKADHAGKSLETWLRDKFFLQHCKLFHHRPFIWHIWDGLRDGFSALVNYHKLDRKNLEALIYTYLGDWIRAQKEAASRGIDGADEKLSAAENLKKRLELILQGEEPYDIFVRWKPIEKQPIGWEPDLNDGVRLNIRPFMTAQVLRFNKKPQLNITWEKDRGKDVESAPWYHMFKGDRINDHHLTLKEKLTARQGKGGQPC